MIQTLIFKPNLLLADCICYYAIREFDCLDDALLKPLCAKNEIHMMFLINSKMAGFNNDEYCNTPYISNPGSGPECVYSGLLTSNKGSIVFKGHVKLLTIHFKAVGFFRLFGISPVEITDRLGDSYDLLSLPVTKLHEQFQEAKTNTELFHLVDTFLLHHLYRRQSGRNDLSLIKVTNFMANQPDRYTVEQLANAANMTLKTFERKFVEQVGINPKLYERLRRFNRALDLKATRPGISWTEICFIAGYYDQNHFIKEFRQFAGMAPVSFFKNSAPPAEHISPMMDLLYE